MEEHGKLEKDNDFNKFEHYNSSSSGRLTQLVECHLYTVEVTGSSPVSPTKITLLKKT